LKETLDDLFGHGSTAKGLGPAEDEAGSDDDSTYDPQPGDLSAMAWQLIQKRRGQPKFRNALIERYGKRCMVTGCKLVAVLEAAHIDPYRVEGHNHAGNGLLLRADIHTLFDLDLLGIEPNDLSVELHPHIADTYRKHVRKALGGVQHRRPLQQALKRRYDKFQNRAKRPL
jgi:putative restriction endonuclease